MKSQEKIIMKNLIEKKKGRALNTTDNKNLIQSELMLNEKEEDDVV